MTSSSAPAAPREGLGRLGVKLYRYRTLIKRQWWILALTIGLGLAYEGWILYQQPHLFESTSQLNIREETSVTGIVNHVTSDMNFVGTNLNYLQSSELLDRTAQRMGLLHPELTGPRPSLSATNIARTQIFVVAGRGAEPVYTQAFVNAALDAFIEWRREIQYTQIAGIGSNFGDKLKQSKTELDEAQAKFRDFVAKNKMEFWSELGKSSASFLSNLKTRQAVLQTELQRFQNLTPDQLLVIPPSANTYTAPPVGNAPGTGEGTGAPATTAAASGSLSADLYSMYLQKSQELSAIESRLEERSKVWKPKHPRLQAMQQEKEQVERSIELIKKQNRDATAQRVDAIKAELVSLDESIKNWSAKVMEANAKDADYRALQDEVTRAQTNYGELSKNKEQVDKLVSTDPFMVLQHATPATPVPAGTMRHLLMGVLGGLVLGLVILGALDRADDRMTSSSEILDQFSEPILGQIPNVADSKNSVGLPLLQPDDERYAYAEAFRSLRSSLIFMPNQTDLQTVLITSAIPNEGKSTIASNLAITMAAAGARVALVDADLRRGDLASLFDLDGRTGLSNILRGEVTVEEAQQETRYPRLTLIPRGPVTNQSSELLLLPTLNALLDNLRAHYDLIVFNTAPILATDDTPSLSPSFDGTLMVMRAQFTSARLTQNSLNALYQRQVNVLGLVLNCIDTEMPDYYYYQYPKYYAAK